jgi:hypothetical protein
MIIFDIHSWHYKLILWTWGEHFFEESNIDWDKMERMNGDDIANVSYDGLPKKYKPKTVNFCPYCRAMVGAVLTAPLLYIYRLFPHKERKDMTRAEIKKAANRRTFISLAVAGGINYAVGFKHILDGAPEASIISFVIGTVLILVYGRREATGKLLIKLMAWLPTIKFPKWKRKTKVKKVKVDRPPSKLLETLKSKHDVYCPPVFFVDKSKADEHT